MSYPESTMNVAVHMGDGLVKVYGYERYGFRKHLRSIQLKGAPEAIHYCTDFNQNEREAMVRRQR